MAASHAADELADRALVLGLRASPDSQALAELRALVSEDGFDWAAWLARAKSLEPLLYRALHGRGILPPAVDEQLEAALASNWIRSEIAARDLDSILRCLSNAQAPVILLKGAALATAIYGDPALRPMVDLDLLVHPGDVERVLEALRGLGYEQLAAEMRLRDAVAYSNEIQLIRPGGTEIPVEIHWSLLDNPLYRDKPSESWLWDTAVPLRLGAWETQMLGPEAQILHLCAHLALHHGGEGLLPMNDIVEVLQRYQGQIDWRVLMAQAQAADLVLPLQQILPRVARGWGATIPAETLAALAALPPSTAEAQVFGGMSAGQRTVAAEVWSDLVGLGAAGRLRYLAAKLFPAPAYMRQRYSLRHAALLPLAYPYRWLLGVRSALALIVRSVLRRRSAIPPSATSANPANPTNPAL